MLYLLLIWIPLRGSRFREGILEVVIFEDF
jgi:hypothetical protein